MEKNIGKLAFADCPGLTSVSIPDNVTVIDDHTFFKCTGLVSVTIPEGVTDIGDYAFFGCTSLKYVGYCGDPAGWKRISIGNNNSILSNAIMIFNAVGYGEKKDFSYFLRKDMTSILVKYTGKDEKVVIPSEFEGYTLTEIGIDSFRNADFITDVTIPDCVTGIGKYAFRGCTSLSDITIPGSVTTIGESAFFGCTMLKKITGTPVKTPVSPSAQDAE